MSHKGGIKQFNTLKAFSMGGGTLLAIELYGSNNAGVFWSKEEKKNRQVFCKCSTKKSRIAHLDPETRMNSKEGFCKEQIFSWSQSVEWLCKEQSLWSGPVVTIQEQHPLGRDRHGRPLPSRSLRLPGGWRCPCSMGPHFFIFT